MEECKIDVADLVLIENIRFRIKVPNNKEELLIDSMIKPVKGDVIAGFFGDEIVLGMKTNDGIQFGFVMDSRLALAISGVLAKAACQGETKQ